MLLEERERRRREAQSGDRWRAADLRWKLYDDQQPFYDFLSSRIYSTEGPGVVVGNVHRQFGKSFSLVLVATEFALRRPGSQIRFVAPTQKALRKIVQPAMRTLLGDCPEDVRPRWAGMDGFWAFPNGSEIHLAGADAGHADDSRGQRSHLNVIDEAGFIDSLDYLLKSVLLPQTLTTGGRTVLISTPPESPAHELIPILRAASASGAYFKHPIDRTTHLSEKARAQLIADMGGPLTTQARRELWCEIVTDEARAVVPEFTEEQAAKLVGPVPPPTFETPLVGLDVGFEDYSHALFGYYDFRNARLCVQSEVRLRRMRTDELADAVKEREAALWPGAGKPMLTFGGQMTAPVPLRVSDVDLILLNDLSQLHGLHFAPTSKDEKEAMVNNLRLWVRQGRLLIDPSCEHLIRQLGSAIWNRARTSFERTSTDGHFDGVDALIYLVRNAPVHANPYPAFDPSITSATHHITAQATQPQADAALRAMFAPRKRA